jgi:hypothetical protein
VTAFSMAKMAGCKMKFGNGVDRLAFWGRLGTEELFSVFCFLFLIFFNFFFFDGGGEDVISLLT